MRRQTSRILNRNTAEAQPFTPKEEVSVPGTRPNVSAYCYRLREFTLALSAGAAR